MHILVTGGTTQLGKMENRDRRARHRLVTLITRHRHMTTRQRKAALLMLCQGHRRCFESIAGVTLLTPVAPGVPRKLALVRVFMTIHTDPELDLVLSLHPGWSVAGGALDRGMRSHQREPCLAVIRNSECRRRPAVNGVATLTSPTVGSFRKLSSMGIRRVAVCAQGVWNRRLEIA